MIARTLLTSVGVMAAFGTFFSAAHAVEPDFRISVTAARAAMITEKAKVGDGKEEEKKVSKLYTMADRGITEFAVNWDGNGIYLLPFSDAGTLVSYAKALNDTMELGVQLGLNGLTEKVGSADESKSSGHRLGLTYWGTMPVGTNAVEVFVNPYLSFGSKEGIEEVTTGTTKTNVKSETSSSSVGAFVEAIYVLPLKKNFDYAAGADLSYATGESKTKLAGGSDVKTKGNTLEMGLILARFRARF